MYLQHWEGTIDGERARAVVHSSDGFVKQRRLDVEVGHFDMPGLFDAMEATLASGGEVIADFRGNGAPEAFAFTMPSGAAVDMESLALWSEKREPACENGTGSALDLSREPVPWIVQRDDMRRWYDPDGCPVRIDVITDSRGSGHCELEDVHFLTAGTQVGDIPGEEPRRTFVYDPKRTLEDSLGVWGESFAGDTQPSAGASPTGYRTADGDELWTDEANPNAPAWIVSDDEVQRWDHAADGDFGCA